MDCPEKKYEDGMMLNLQVLTVKRTVLLFSVIGLVGVSCLLDNKTGKKKKNSLIKDGDKIEKQKKCSFTEKVFEILSDGGNQTENNDKIN